MGANSAARSRPSRAATRVAAPRGWTVRKRLRVDLGLAAVKRGIRRPDLLVPAGGRRAVLGRRVTVHDERVRRRSRTAVRGVVPEVVVRDRNGAVVAHGDVWGEPLLVAERDVRR